MKNKILFKSLINILYYLHFIGLFGITLILFIGIFNAEQENLTTNSISFAQWSNFLITLIIYLLFLRGLHYLRKVAKIHLEGEYFSGRIIHNLKKSGILLISTGSLYFLQMFVSWTYKLYINKLTLTYDSDIIIAFFLIIIGLFMLIQSKTLLLAKSLKEEHDLTV